MGKQLDKNTLGYLGLDFQYKLAKTFVEDSKFFEDTASIINQNAFTDSLLKTFVGVIKDYYSKQSTVPSYETIGIILREKAKTQLEIEECDALIKKIKFETSLEGYSVVKEDALKFFKQQNLIKVANKILEIASKGDIDKYDECQKLLEEASMAGQDDDFGFNIYEMQEKALANDYTVSIPTGISKLDEVLGGGLDKGKLGLLIAPAGFGKTSFTTAIDAYAASYRCDVNNHEGFKVLQIYFEDDDVDITRKHFAKETGIEARYMKRLEPTQREEIASMLNNSPNKEMLKNNLRLKHFKTGTKSASDIGIFIKRLINSGFKPDMVSIDYFECLAAEKGGYATDSEWTREGVTMRVLENLAHELNCAIWIPTQGTKDSMNSPEVVRMDQASGSAKKIHVAQLILSIARAIGDIDKSKAVISILKNRSGKSGKIFRNVKFNNGTCEISCDDVEEFDDDLAFVDKQKDLVEENKVNMTRKLSQMQRQVEQHFSDNQFDSKREPIQGNYIGHI
jgi:replicative DNA helicase